MRIVRILGGLGNQMFQFALYEALRREYPEERVLTDLHGFRGYGKHRGYELAKVFGIEAETATLREIASIAYPYPNYQAWRIGSRLLPARKTMLCEKANFALEPEALTRTGSTYYDGYWQHEEYFGHIRQAICQMFRFPALQDPDNRQAADRILAHNTCAIHIRRGDYLTDPLRKGTIGTDYTARAIRRMQETANPDRWCVFSDDMPWTSDYLRQLLPESQTIFADWNQGEKSINDMHLMTLCRHHIIANSSFSWWGAWLCTHDGQTVIAPRRWMNCRDVCSPVPDRWQQL